MKKWIIIEKNHEERVDNPPVFRDNSTLIDEDYSMDFAVTGQIKNKRLVEFYVKQMIKELGMNRLRKPVIHIKFVTHADGADGLCDGEKNKYAEILIARKCPHTGRKFGFVEMMQTLAHEMVHARQFIRGQLFNQGGWAWKGRNADGYEYQNQPWEKEAYRLEKELFMECFPHFAEFTN